MYTSSKNLYDSYLISITGFCDSLLQLSYKNTTPVVLLEISKSICRTSLNRYVCLLILHVCAYSFYVSPCVHVREQ